MRRFVVVVQASLVVQALALGGCTGANEPSARGVILRGSVTGSILDARFEVSNGWLTCAGLYPSYRGRIVTVTLKCDDGLAGVALVTRRDAFDGRGTVLFSDGSEGSFVFGRDVPRSGEAAAPPSEGVASTAVAR